MIIKDIMKVSKSARSPVVVDENENIDNAALLMKENELKEIAVVNSKDEPVGVVTREILLNNSDELNQDFFLD